MSIEQQLIARIDTLESDKTNEDSPDDLSNRAAEKIRSELAELEDFITELNLNPEQAIKLRESFQRDLEKILWDTQNELVDLEYVINKDIWNQATVQEVHKILEENPWLTKEEIINLLIMDYDIDLSVIWDNPDIPFPEIEEHFSNWIGYLNAVDSVFPEVHRKESYSIIDAHAFLQTASLEYLISWQKFQEFSDAPLFNWNSFEDFKTWLESDAWKQVWEKFTYISENYPDATHENIFKFIEEYQEVDLSQISEYIEWLSFDEIITYMNHFDGKHLVWEQPELMFRDPSFGHYHKIESEGILSERFSDKFETQLYVARNLYFQGISPDEITPEICEKELRLIENTDALNLSEIYIFKGRNVVLAAHEEDLSQDLQQDGETERFGKQATIDAIRESGGSLPSERIIHPTNTRESLEHAKNQTLDAIVNTAPPLTFVFDGHGSHEGIYFSDGEYEDGGFRQQTWERQEVDTHSQQQSVYISYQEFAQALKRRVDAWNMSKEDIIVIEACSNQSFMRNVFQELRNIYQQEWYQDTIFPYMIGPSEFDQLSYSDNTTNQGSQFFAKTLWLGSPSWEIPISIQTVIDKEYEVFDDILNPSVFIPDNSWGFIRQMAENDFWDQTTGLA